MLDFSSDEENLHESEDEKELDCLNEEFPNIAYKNFMLLVTE